METRIHRNQGEGRVIEIRSFSDPNLTYRVNVEALTCTCGRFVHTQTCLKHILLGRAIAELQDRVKQERLRFGYEAAVEEVTDLVERMYSKLTVQESYRLYCSVFESPYASRAMRNTAQRRHLGLVEAA